ncbi:hypothetical protein [Xanthomonas phage RTH11]|nr:hypothetical protein [Xanthomonas phage RTH11]
MKGRTEEEAQTQLQIQAAIPGAFVAYRDGDDVISLHEDSLPESQDNAKARRVTAVVPW